MRRCAKDGCNNETGPSDFVCRECLTRAAAENASISLHASVGIRELRHMLERHAEFQEWLIEHGQL